MALLEGTPSTADADVIDTAVQRVLEHASEPLGFAELEAQVATQLSLKSGIPVRKAAWRLVRAKKASVLPGMRLVKG